MVQTQSYNNVLNLAFMLPIKEQRQLIRDVQIHLSSHLGQDAQSHSWEELRAGVREAEEQIAAGQYFSSEEDDRLFDEFIENDLKVAL